MPQVGGGFPQALKVGGGISGITSIPPGGGGRTSIPHGGGLTSSAPHAGDATTPVAVSDRVKAKKVEAAVKREVEAAVKAEAPPTGGGVMRQLAVGQKDYSERVLAGLTRRGPKDRTSDVIFICRSVSEVLAIPPYKMSKPCSYHSTATS
jgi:hypothetical protein